MEKKILFLVPYPTGCAASQRFRFELYYNILKNKGFSITVSSFLSLKTWNSLYQKGHFFNKTNALIVGWVKRILLLKDIKQYDFVFIHREAAPVGPPILEWLIAKVFKKRIIYDFDDAIWIPNASDSNRIMFYLKRFDNPSAICRLAYKVSCGNDYLRRYALQYNTQTYLIPTVVDTNTHHNKVKLHDSNDFVIGWTGTHSTIRYLNELVPVLRELERELKFKFIIISDRKPDFQLASLQYIEWKKETEIQDLLLFNIGLMPLTHDAWAEGKCGFKAIQYMALAIPALVSDVGVNESIVDNGINGYVCSSLADWKANIKYLYENRAVLLAMSGKCRAKIIDQYSAQAQEENFLQLFS